MRLRCPRCNSVTNELIECEECGAIGCVRCMRRKHGRWVCFKCEKEEVQRDEVSSAFAAMFG
ncbi:MAG TPA: hypothetical protein ENG34_00040 [Candidatus Aenigmarchaeota archaeon]|nr:hypothetical protein [Candidatus Aenigmarchaeota archaeon]